MSVVTKAIYRCDKCARLMDRPDVVIVSMGEGDEVQLCDDCADDLADWIEGVQVLSYPDCKEDELKE